MKWCDRDGVLDVDCIDILAVVCIDERLEQVIVADVHVDGVGYVNDGVNGLNGDGYGMLPTYLLMIALMC